MNPPVPVKAAFAVSCTVVSLSMATPAGELDDLALVEREGAAIVDYGSLG